MKAIDDAEMTEEVQSIVDGQQEIQQRMQAHVGTDRQSSRDSATRAELLHCSVGGTCWWLE